MPDWIDDLGEITPAQYNELMAKEVGEWAPRTEAPIEFIGTPRRTSDSPYSIGQYYNLSRGRNFPLRSEEALLHMVKGADDESQRASGPGWQVTHSLGENVRDYTLDAPYALTLEDRLRIIALIELDGDPEGLAAKWREGIGFIGRFRVWRMKASLKVHSRERGEPLP